MYTVIPLISTISEDAQVNRRFLSLCEFIFDLQDDVFFFGSKQIFLDTPQILACKTFEEWKVYGHPSIPY